MGREYILCVDDEAIILESLKREMLDEFGKDYDIETARGGAEALALASELSAQGVEPAALITDQRMPGMDGSELMARVKALYPEVRCIMLTGYTDTDALRHAINAEALFRFISKPWAPFDLELAVRRALELRALSVSNKSLLGQLEALNRTIVDVLDSVVDSSDPETHSHDHRVSCYSALLAREVGCDLDTQRKIFVFSSLHDIGKIGIPKSILLKPGPLSAEEWGVMRKHVTIGARIVQKARVDRMLSDLTLYHHEWWDGSGYPDGLAGKKIPLSARIVAIADVLDALLSERPYKERVDFGAAVETIRREAGTHFDPELVERFEDARILFGAFAEDRTVEECIRSLGLAV